MHDTWISFPDSNAIKIAVGESPLDNPQLQRKLHQFHSTHGRPSCGCYHEGSHVELVIRRLSNGKYTLACFPFAGHHHRYTCAFYQAEPKISGRHSYSPRVISVREDGVILADIAWEMRITSATRTVQEAGSHRKGDGNSEAGITLGGALDLLWERAGLNQRRAGQPGVTEPWRVARDLSIAAEGIRLSGIRMADHLGVILPDATTQNTVTLNRLARAPQDTRWLVVAAVHAIDPEIYGKNTILFDGNPGYPVYLGMKPDALSLALSNAPYANRILLGLPERRNARVIGLFSLKPPRQPTGKNYLSGEIEHAAFMATTADLVPVEDAHQRDLAEELIRTGRAFIRPLRFDASRSENIPDFELLDAEQGPTQLRIRAAGAASHSADPRDRPRPEGSGNESWVWFAEGPRRSNMPPLPPRRLATP